MCIGRKVCRLVHGVNVFECVCMLLYVSLLYKLYMSVNTCVHVYVSVLVCIRGCWPCPGLMFLKKSRYCVFQYIWCIYLSI